MQTILGSTGQIATELARNLHHFHTSDLRLVSRNPRRVNATDTLMPADLLDVEQTHAAVAGSDIVYFTAGLPADTELWEAQFPTMLQNALDATKATGAKFVYFDNTYMYPQDDEPQNENTAFAPVGRKGKVRAQMTNLVLAEIKHGQIPVLIARAPEFYGPGRTQSFTNSLVIERLLQGQRALVPVHDDRLRTLIWTPDASRALALLGNTPDAYGQTWHLPADDNRLTYRQFVTLASQVFNSSQRYTVLPRWVLNAMGLLSSKIRELRELLPRYATDNIFETTKFIMRFPDFKVTTYSEGLKAIREESNAIPGGGTR